MIGKHTSIQSVKGLDSEYVIKDSLGINIGRIFIIDLSKENKFTLIRLKFYKNGENLEIYLRESMELLFKTLFNKMDMQKVSLIVDEELNINSLFQYGIILEGILNNSIFDGKTSRNEFVLGIEKQVFLGRDIISNLILKGQSIDLRILTPEHDEKILDYYIRNKEYLKDFEPTREIGFYTLEEQREILKDNYKQYLNGTAMNFGLFKKDKLIGRFQCSNIVEGIFKNGVIGYSIDEKFQGKGYMKEALDLFLKYAFEELGLHRVEASTLVDNIKSQKVLERCGFIKLGVNKEYLYINGQWQDHISFYKIKEKTLK